MTENKRFDVYTELLHTGIGITDKGKELTGNDVVTLLNQLTNENEELKVNCRNYEWYKAYKELLNENEQLKQEIQGLKDDRTRFEEEARIDAIDKALDEENEQLKRFITSMGFTIKKENGNIIRLTKEDRK